MFVRVFNKRENTYFKSVVYAMVNTGWFLQYIVLNPKTQSFELVDGLDRSCSPAESLVETIQDDCSGFKVYEGAYLLKYKYYCKEKRNLFEDINRIVGYADICETCAFIVDIFETRSVPVNAYNLSIRKLNDEDEWNYILTQADANDFMKKFVGFHDSTLEKLTYFVSDSSASVIATFDNSGWFGVVELYFEGVQILKIVPALSNYTREILDASLIVEAESIFWADEYMESVDLTYAGSFIKALSLKWRRIDDL